MDSGYPEALIEPFTIRLEQDTEVSITPEMGDEHGPVYLVDFTRPRHLPRREVWPAELAHRLYTALGEALGEAVPGPVTSGNDT